MSLLLAVLLAAAPHPTSVAVFTFKSLSGPETGLGEGLRETITLDLRETSGLRVVERAHIERVLAEQRLGDALEPETAARAGRLFGADLLVLGAYQRVEGRVRLTARFVRSETGEIVGTAKVDGPETEVLKLEDQVAAELLRTSGFPARAAREWPTLTNLTPVELFGRASAEPSEPTRRALLAEVVRTQPSFPYAAKELDALERHLRELETQARAASRAREGALEAELAQAAELVQRVSLRLNLVSLLIQQRRLEHALTVLADQVEDLKGQPHTMAESWTEAALAQRLSLLEQLRRPEQLMAEGETFLKEHLTSNLATVVRSLVEQTIAHQRQVAHNAEVAAGIASKLKPAQQEPCHLAPMYASFDLAPDARRLWTACLETPGAKRETALRGLVEANLALGDWPPARAALAQYAQEFPLAFEQLRASYRGRVPEDD